MTPIQLVTDWHRKFAVEMPDTPTFDPGVCALRIALISEESKELEDAIFDSNRVEILDALCDLQYVLSGTVVATGMDSMVSKFSTPKESDVAYLVRRFQFQTTRLAKDLARGYPANIGNRLSVMQDLLDQIIGATGFDGVFARAFLAVHNNNCGKTWTPSEFTDANDGRLRAWPCEWRAGCLVVKNEIGKVMKPPGFEKVELSEFVS